MYGNTGEERRRANRRRVKCWPGCHTGCLLAGVEEK